jgi:lysophospholipase L1-like esterase
MKKKIDQTSIRGYDPLLGYAYSNSQDIPLLHNEEYKNGLIYIGNQDNPRITIAVLGGSTSDISYEGSWLRPFFNLLKNNEVLLVSAAMSGYSTSQELLKLIRDVIPQNPDVVISLNGVNDLGFMHTSSPKFPLMHKYQVNIGEYLVRKFGAESKASSFLNKYSAIGRKPTGMNSSLSLGSLILGYENDISPSESWFRNLKMAKALCDSFSIKYIAFLQPVFGIGKYKGTKEDENSFLDYAHSMNLVHGKKYNFCLNSFYRNARKVTLELDDYIIDFVDVFEGHHDVYSDARHPNTKGNDILAKNIFKSLKEKKILKD